MPFDPEQRKIFSYPDGTMDADGNLRMVRGDPIALYRQLLGVAGGTEKFEELWQRAQATEPIPGSPITEDGRPPRRYTDEALFAQGEMADVVVRAFNLKRLDPDGPDGLTEGEIREVLFDFFEHQKKRPTNGETSPKFSAPTAASPSPSTGSPTNSSTDSGSTAAGSRPSPRR
jgi:hypothetical protein